MNRLAIYKASAGSGKTFRLTGEYLELLFDPEVKFYNILAVTFTNKATAEMRERILQALHNLANNNSPYCNELKEKYKLTDNQVSTKASFLLNNILYNYSRFNVSTIDSFFQKILKSFAYETGLSSSFNIELNLQNILEISIEQFFEKAQKKPVIKNWLMNYAIQKIEDGKNWDIEKDIFNFSKDAFNEVFFSFSEKQLKALSNIELFNNFKSSISIKINEFIDTIQEFGNSTTQHLLKHNLEVNDFTRGKNGVAGFMARLSNVSKNNIKEPGSTVYAAQKSPDGIQGWCTKTSKKQTEVQECVNNGFAKIVDDYLKYFNTNFETFNTINAIYKGIDVFAVIVEVYNQMIEYCREKNIFLLPLASPLLSKMIDDSDAPFIYEKTGSYLKHFMIDEFQDTSKIQWDNFLPLFLNGISQNYKSLVVGDVKQSIYRWRNGDWTLLNSKLEERFKSYGVKHELLKMNWRSTPEIVNFNNSVFKNITQYTSLYLESKNTPDNLIEPFTRLTHDIYDTAVQEIPASNNNKQGYIKVAFNSDTDKSEFEEWCLDNMIASIEELLNSGTQPKDIAILVRKGKEGALVAKHLMKHIRNNPSQKHLFSFVSNDSVLLGNSSIILLLISLLQFTVNKNNLESRATILYYYFILRTTPTEAAQKLSEINLTNIDDFMAHLPESFVKHYELLAKQPFGEIIIWLLNNFIYPLNNQTVQQQLPFIHTFQDLVLNFTKNNGSDIDSFLTWWQEFGINTPINLSENQNAIRIVTIHKSKGLEYNAVIMPFTNWGLDQLSKYIWCESPINNSEFPIVPVMYSSTLGKSKFSEAYFTEKTMALIDNLNLLYVAFTRAKESLYVFAPLPKKNDDYKNISDLLYALFENNSIKGNWNTEEQTYSNGQITKHEAIAPNIDHDKSIYIKTLPRNIKIKRNASDFFKNDNGDLCRKINMGSIYHKIMEQISTFNDIDKAILKARSSSLLTDAQAQDFKHQLLTSINNTPQKDWFSNKYQILNEIDLIQSNQSIKRPDRVLINENEVIVVDYKFTQQKHKKHQLQVKEYMQLIQQIENKPTKGFVWYVLSGEITEIN